MNLCVGILAGCAPDSSGVAVEWFAVPFRDSQAADLAALQLRNRP